MEGSDLDAYRAAVASGNLMAMRQAAFEPGTVEGSAKLARLVDLLDDATSACSTYSPTSRSCSTSTSGAPT